MAAMLYEVIQTCASRYHGFEARSRSDPRGWRKLTSVEQCSDLAGNSPSTNPSGLVDVVDLLVAFPFRGEREVFIPRFKRTRRFTPNSGSGIIILKMSYPILLIFETVTDKSSGYVGKYDA